MAFSLWTWACDKLKPATSQQITLKKHHLSELYTWACGAVRWHWSVDTLFDSCQFTVTWLSIRMSTQVKHLVTLGVIHLLVFTCRPQRHQQNYQGGQCFKLNEINLLLCRECWHQWYFFFCSILMKTLKGG